VSDSNRKQWSLVIPVLLLVVIASTWWFYQNRSIILVTVENTGTTAMKASGLNYAGGTSELGDIAPGENSQTRIDPSGEKSVTVTYSDGEGGEKMIEVECSLKKDSRGQLNIKIKDGKLESVNQDDS